LSRHPFIHSMLIHALPKFFSPQDVLRSDATRVELSLNLGDDD
jgi:hypothetical protein